jgi:outer membrane receptor protein involved in Fe transport
VRFSPTGFHKDKTRSELAIALNAARRYAVLDLSDGRHISPDLSVSITALNVANRHLLTDDSLTFGGVHWNTPFQIYAELRYKFHY